MNAVMTNNKLFGKRIEDATVGDFAKAVVLVMEEKRAERPKRKRTYEVPDGAVSRDEAEVILGLAPMQVSNLIREGKLKAYGSPRKQWFYRTDLERLQAA